MSDARELIRILALKDVDVAFAAADVQALLRRVIEQIVGVADDVECRLFFSGGRGWITTNLSYRFISVL